MPFELGLFLVARRFGAKLQRDKQCLVLEAERYRYQKYLTDISGQDIRQHDNEPAKAVGAVRDWLAAPRSKSAKPLPGTTASSRRTFPPCCGLPISNLRNWVSSIWPI